MLGVGQKVRLLLFCPSGAPSIPGSSWVTSEAIMKLRPNKVAHTNGGSTAVSFDHIQRLMDESDIPLELVVNGNFVNFNKMMKHMNAKNELNRMVFGSDAPTGQASLPGAINRAIVKASSLNDVPAWKCIKAWPPATQQTSMV